LEGDGTPRQAGLLLALGNRACNIDDGLEDFLELGGCQHLPHDTGITILSVDHQGALEFHDKAFTTAAERLEVARAADREWSLIRGSEEETGVDEELLALRNLVSLDLAIASSIEEGSARVASDRGHKESLTAEAAHAAASKATRHNSVASTANEGAVSQDPAVARSGSERQDIPG